MTNVLYPLGKQAFLSGQINMLSDIIKVALVANTYTYSASDQYWSNINSNVVGTPQTLANISVTAGVLNGSNTTYTAITGNQVKAAIIYKDTATPSTSPLIAYIDTGTGLPVTPNGGDLTLSWDAGNSHIFSL